MQSDVFKTIERNYEYKRNLAIKNAIALKEETYDKFPRLKEIDNLIFKTNIAINVPIIVVIPESAVAKLCKKPSVITSISLTILEIKSPCEELSIKLIGTLWSFSKSKSLIL